METSQRHLLPLTDAVLHRRGYRSADATEPVLDTTNPHAVGTREELLQALRCLRISQGNPSLRTMSQQSETIPEGLDERKHRARSYNTLRWLVHPTTPSETTLVNVLAFVRGCGITDPDLLRAWEEAYLRVAVAETAAPPRPSAALPPIAVTGPQFSHRPPTGPQYSFRSLP